MAPKRSAGGSATARGIDFQNRVAAWVAVQILAEKAASPLWDLSAGTSLEWFRCETQEPVDDLLAGTSNDGLIFFQIKHRLDASGSPNSPLASVCDQFVRQFIKFRLEESNRQVEERQLIPATDRIVLTVGPNSSQPIRVHFPAVLKRVRETNLNISLESVANNREEKRVLSYVVENIKRSWKKWLGTYPAEEDIRRLLSLVRVQDLNVDAGGHGELEAKNQLRTSILSNTAQADVAWARLTSLCAQLAGERSGTNRPGLQQTLLDADMSLHIPRSYRNDITRLKTESEEVSIHLSDLAQIRVGQTEIKINRDSTVKLREAVEEGSLLVVGKPGTGKSGALYDLVIKLQEEKRDVVFLVVDRVAARSLGEMREELGLEHNLQEVLTNWPGKEPAFMVIDALDAARADPAARAIRNLIELVVKSKGRWRVVASIRKFDLRYSQELQRLFVGHPLSTYQDGEFRNIRHLNIPELSDEELGQVQTQSPRLGTLIRKAPKKFRDLLNVPFNLRLLADLVETGLEEDELNLIQTQVELLDLYWKNRLIRSDEHGGSRELVLKKICEQMVEKKILRINRLDVLDSTAGPALQDLLSNHILVEWQSSEKHAPNRDVLAFSHHVLFDYSVSMLLLNTPDNLINRLANDREFVLVVRPSLVIYFQRVWFYDASRNQFWESVIRVMVKEVIPEIGKIIGPSVGAELATDIADLEPLCSSIESAEEKIRIAAEKGLDHLVGWLITTTGGDRPLSGPQSGPWCELLERVSRTNLTNRLAYIAQQLFVTICEKPELLTVTQRENAGKAARKFLEYVWANIVGNPYIVGNYIQAVCRTFESDLKSSASVLRNALEPDHLSKHGFEELHWLTREVKRLITIDPSFVAEIYRSAFSYSERRTDQTAMGLSQILSLSSTIKQDYRMALYSLTEEFPEFLDYSSALATSVLVMIIDQFVVHEHAPSSGELIEKSFEFNGNQAQIVTDYSVIWDSSDVYRHEDQIKMLDALENYLEQLAKQEENSEKLRTLIEILTRENRQAILWRHLLSLGSRFPETIGSEIRSLSWSVPILTSYDTIEPAGNFLKVMFEKMTAVERKRVEVAILSIPNEFSTDQNRYSPELRNRFLGCLPESAIVTEEARQIFRDLKASDAFPPNEPPVKFSGLISSAYGEEEFLRDQGVPVDQEENRKIREFELPVKQFADSHLNSTPALEQITSIFPALQTLRTALLLADEEGVHPNQSRYAWACLSSACERIARFEELSCEGEVGSFAQSVLLKTSFDPDPEPHPNSDSRFDEFVSWSGPASRIEAAQGLILLCQHPTCVNNSLLQRVEELSKDPVPEVRYQIASRLNALYQTSPEPMWKIAGRLCEEEQSRGVLQGLVSVLGRLANVRSDLAVPLAKKIFNRVTEGSGAETVRAFCIDIFTSLYIWRDQSQCKDLVFEITGNPFPRISEAHHVLRHLQAPFTHGPDQTRGPQQQAPKRRALELFIRILQSASESLHSFTASHEGIPSSSWQKEDLDYAKSLFRIHDDISRELLTISQALEQKRQSANAAESDQADKVTREFYHDVEPILNKLADAGIPAIAHHLLQILEVFIHLFPGEVFLRIGDVIRKGKKGGYQYESMAVDLLVRLVERYLAEYRPLLRENDQYQRTLLEVLDIFVEVGWPSARRLTYRLEEIFR